MKNNSLVAGRWSLVAGRWSLVAGLLSLCVAVTANAQSISSARNAAPSNCDTGCAQSGLAGVSGNNSGSSGWNVVFQGKITGGKTFTVTKQSMVMLNVQNPNSAYMYLRNSAGTDIDGCTGKSNQNDTSAAVRVTGSNYVSGSCIIPAGTYTARAYRSMDVATGYLYVAELPN